MTEKYKELAAQMEAVLEKSWPLVSNLSNAAGVLYVGMEKINWAGFYLLGDPGRRMVGTFAADSLYPVENTEDKSDRVLWLGPFQGKPACVRIAMGKGVCGTAAFLGQTQLVEDVHQFPGHIACDSESRSEIVVPLKKGGRVIGVLDIDSPVCGRFTEEDREGLEAVAELIGKVM